MRRPKLSSLAAIALAVAVLAPTSSAIAAPPAASPSRSVDGLLESFARMPGLSAKFREEKRMALLAAPLINEGTLHFHKGRLARHTHSPAKSSLVIHHDRLEFGDASGQEHLDLANNPVVKLFVDSFTKILAGDRAALERIYTMKFEPVPTTPDGWKLVLRPRLAPMNAVIDRLELEGTGIVVKRMLVVEIGGDETLTTFSDVDVNRRYSAAEAEQVFRVHVK